MKTRIISAITAILAVAGAVAPVALAKDNSTRPVQTIRTEIKDLRTDFRSELASKSQQLKDELKQQQWMNKKSRIRKWWVSASQRLQKLITHERNILTRIEKRLVKLEAAGGNTEKARAQLKIATAAVDAAQQALDSANKEAPAIILSDATPAEIFKKLRELHKGVVSKIRIANHEIVTLIRLVKSIPTLTNPNATATPTPTATP